METKLPPPKVQPSALNPSALLLPTNSSWSEVCASFAFADCASRAGAQETKEETNRD